MTMAMWMDRLDDLCESDADMAIHDLPDVFFRVAYSSGITPEEFRGRPYTLPQFAIAMSRDPQPTGAPVVDPAAAKFGAGDSPMSTTAHRVDKETKSHSCQFRASEPR